MNGRSEKIHDCICGCTEVEIEHDFIWVAQDRLRKYTVLCPECRMKSEPVTEYFDGGYAKAVEKWNEMQLKLSKNQTGFKNIMIDLETLATCETAVFPVIAGVKFDPLTGEIGETFSRNIDVHDQVERGREVSTDTVAWWFRQSDKARELLMMPGEKLSTVLIDFEEFCGEDPILWAKGSSFDFPILRNAYGRFTPWDYGNEMDMRTVVSLSGINVKEIEFEGIEHNAIDDCIHQVKVLYEALKSLGIADE